jgi:hypothetical protein
MIGHSEI